jgi:hypothetical protein
MSVVKKPAPTRPGYATRRHPNHSTTLDVKCTPSKIRKSAGSPKLEEGQHCTPTAHQDQTEKIDGHYYFIWGD